MGRWRQRFPEQDFRVVVYAEHTGFPPPESEAKLIAQNSLGIFLQVKDCIFLRALPAVGG